VKTFRTAIIGAGSIAGNHLEAMRQAGARVEAAAAVDVEAARVQDFAARYSIPAWYTDAAQMLAATQPDLVHICTPPRTHLGLVVDCLEAGAWVLCEKPLCASLAEFDRIQEAEQRTGRYVSTVFQWRFGSGAQHVKRLITAGELGRALVGTCQTLWYRGADYYAVPWRGKWATETGGTTIMHGIHLTDLFLWLMDSEWQEVQAIIGALDRSIEVDNVSMALARFASGALGSLISSAVSPRQESALRLDFQRATVEVRALYYASNAHWHFSIPESSPDGAALEGWRAIPGDATGDHAAQLVAVLDSLERNERPPVSGADARRIIEFVASLYKSALTGQPVRRGSITPDDPFYHAMNGQPSG
jgi:predicted dehydrogenase